MRFGVFPQTPFDKRKNPCPTGRCHWFAMGIMAEGMTHAPNSLSCQRRTQRDPRETLRKSDAHWKIGLSAAPEVISKAVDLMHALMQDGHDPDVAIREMTPVD